MVLDVAGDGFPGFVDGPAGHFSAVEFDKPYSVAVDAQGNVFVADTGNQRIRRIDPQLNVTTVAGSGSPGFADGTGGRAGTARFNKPSGVAVDGQGQLYVADVGNNRIRRLDAQGNVTTLAGSGVAGFADGSGSAAEFDQPTGVAVDAAGNVYVADFGNQRIRKIDAQGQVSTLAGDGAAGFADGPGASAEFDGPNAVAVDAMGQVYVADSANNRIRKIDAQGQVSTLAGNGRPGFVDGSGGPGGSAEFALPYGVAVDAQGQVVVADYGNFRIRRIDAQGNVTTLAGNGTPGWLDGSGGPDGQAEFNFPYGVAVDAAGAVYVTDSGNNRIRRVDAQGHVVTVAGNGLGGFADGLGFPEGFAEFDFPTGLAVDSQGQLYVADTYSNCLRLVR